MERGLQTLRSACMERDDGKFEYIRDVTSIEVHTVCRRNYVRKNSIVAFVSKRECKGPVASTPSMSSPPRTRLRVSDQLFFNFETEEANKENDSKKPKTSRLKYSLVSGQDFTYSIINTARKVGGI